MKIIFFIITVLFCSLTIFANNDGKGLTKITNFESSITKFEDSKNWIFQLPPTTSGVILFRVTAQTKHIPFTYTVWKKTENGVVKISYQNTIFDYINDEFSYNPFYAKQGEEYLIEVTANLQLSDEQPFFTLDFNPLTTAKIINTK